MFKNAPEYGYFSETIIAALSSRSDDDNYNEQLCELAYLMGLNGDSSASAALREFILAQSRSDDITGARAIVALDGVPAVVELARHFGRILEEKPNEYVDSLEYLTEGSQIFDDAYSELKRQAPDDRAIAAYVATENRRIAEKKQRELETPDQIAARRNAYREEF
jgi:hypothetical protein